MNEKDKKDINLIMNQFKISDDNLNELKYSES